MIRTLEGHDRSLPFPHMPPCPRRLMQVVTRLRGEVFLGQNFALCYPQAHCYGKLAGLSRGFFSVFLRCCLRLITRGSSPAFTRGDEVHARLAALGPQRVRDVSSPPPPASGLRTRAPGSQGEDQGTPAQPSHTGSRRRTHDASGPGCPGNNVPAGYQFGTRSFPPRCMPTPLLALRYARRGSWQAASLLFGLARVSLPLPLLPTRHSGCRRATSDPSVK